MSRTRFMIAVGIAVLLLVLLVWQEHRRGLIAQCVESGGRWVGPQSRCAPDPNRITIQRDLHRS